VNTHLQALKIDSTRYETKLEDLEAEIRDELGGLKEVKENKPADDVKPAELKGKIGQLKRQLELIGGIDPAVEQEYIDTKERYDFLTGQVTDFSQAVESLEKIIKELDQTIRQQFDKEFKLIEQNFEKYFKILFNGGSAKIIKVMEDEKGKSGNEEGEVQEEEAGKNAKGLDLKRIKFLQKHNATGLAGIEIQATPPGKKIKSISMLSGGERALTAIALICAIISANPSPFVVLDEVDAALDEANSERLAKILDELSHKTQFIVITHNRASMRRANVLYGVTMGDDGVSKLLSIKLDEAKKMEEEKTDDRKQMTE
jgi:chromosome segregation protein